MKKLKYIIYPVLFLLLLAPAGCDILDTVPTDRVSTEIYWETEQDAQYVANAIYRSLDGTGIFHLDGVTDILHGNIQFSDWATIERGEFDSNMEYIQTVYTDCYTGIRGVNYFLENVGRIDVEDRTKLNILSGEVRFIRAYLYIKLVMLYGEVPLITETIESVSNAKEVKRDDTDVIWNFINRELSEIINILPEQPAALGRITKGAALALAARAYLYQSNWGQAEAMAKAVMDMNRYRLYPAYEKLFSYEAENNVEIILSKQHIKDSYSNNVFYLLAPFSQRSQGPTYVPTKNIFDAYRMTNGKMIHEEGSGFTYATQYENRDPRLRYSIFLPGDILPNENIYEPTPGSGGQDEVGSTYLATTLGYNIKKYINKEDLTTHDNCGIDIILIRYAEVLLTYAEACVEQNKLDDSVYEAIDRLRKREDVNMPELTRGMTQSELRETIRNERMVELAFEGFRLFDCRRWRIAEDLFPGKVYGMNYQNSADEWITVTIDGFTKVFNPEKHYLWPIPQKEMDLNSNFYQNPNW